MNYFEYFSEIEEHFVARRGSVLLLSTLDWALIETWQQAGVPLAAVLRGIDAAFDKYEARRAQGKGRLARVNGLAWCAQAVMQAAVELAEAAVGAHPAPGAQHRAEQQAGGRETGFEAIRVARFLEGNSVALGSSPLGLEAVRETSARLRELAAEVRATVHPVLDELDRRLTVLEERLLAAVVTGLPESEILTLRETVDRELAPLRSRVGAVQSRQLGEQMVHKRLFAAYGLPRLSLFYMPLDPGNEEAGA